MCVDSTESHENNHNPAEQILKSLRQEDEKRQPFNYVNETINQIFMKNNNTSKHKLI